MHPTSAPSTPSKAPAPSKASTPAEAPTPSQSSSITATQTDQVKDNTASSSPSPQSAGAKSSPGISNNSAVPSDPSASAATGTDQATSANQAVASDASHTGLSTSLSTAAASPTGNAESAATSPTRNVGGVSTNAPVTHLSTFTSNGQVYTSTSVDSGATGMDPGPTGVLSSSTQATGFFTNHGAVAGVFLVVGLAVLGLLGFLIFALCRRRRRNRIEPETRQPTLPHYGTYASDDDMHYRRTSQIRALGNVLSAGAPRPRALSGHSLPSEDSHVQSHETYYSSDPINGGETNPFANHHAASPPLHGYADLPDVPPVTQPLPQLIRPLAQPPKAVTQPINPFILPTNPFANDSRDSVASGVESTPSIYPPTLPMVDDDDDYWRRQEHEDLPELGMRGALRETEDPPVRQQPTPPESALGLWTNHSQSTVTQHNTSEENEIVRSLHPQMQYKGSTAPIANLPRLEDHEGRHVLNSGWTVPNRGEPAPR